MKKTHKGFYDTQYYDIHPAKTTNAWRNGFFSANGETGIIEILSPYNDVIIYNNTKCVMESVNPMETPEFTEHMYEFRKNVLNKNCVGEWTEHIKKYWEKRYGMENYGSCGSRSYFPAGQLRIESNKGELNEYKRETDFETGEIKFVAYDGGNMFRKSFVSRENGIAVTFSESDSERDYRISFDNIFEMGIDSKIIREVLPEVEYTAVKDEKISLGIMGKIPISHIDNNNSNPITTLSGSGFAVAVKIITDGKTEIKENIYEIAADGRFFGRDENQREAIAVKKKYVEIKSARNILILAKVDYKRCGFSDINDVKEKLYDKMAVELNTYIDKNSIKPNGKSYEYMMQPHKKLHSEMFNSVSLDLCTESDEKFKGLSNKALHIQQQLGNESEGEFGINKAWLNRLYDNSRFAMVCSHGYSTARLGGIWIGNFMASWSGDHTVNANTNAQVSGINTGNIPECAESYINFVLDYAPDWVTNAEMLHGMKNAIKAPARTDGAGCGKFYSTPFGYPMIFWNSGAAWQLLPIFEYWECYGNRTVRVRYDLDIERLKVLLDLSDKRTDEIKSERTMDLEQDILKPLITKLMNFWIQFVDDRFYIDESRKVHVDDGTVLDTNKNHRYLFVPGYSPENGYCEEVYNRPETVAANCTIDIAAARDSVRMAKMLVKKGVIDAFSESELAEFEKHIPEYLYNERGALKEWALDIFGEHDNHRHSSHLYPAWPGYEIKNNNELALGIKQAIKARRIYAKNERITGFGRMQLAMAAARIRNKELYSHCLFELVGADFEYPSLMTSHDMGLNSAFCTDNAMSINGVINEALVYSDSESIVLLPCSIWERGEVKGLMTRCGVRINSLKWDKKHVEAELEPVRETESIKVEFEDNIQTVDADDVIKIVF